jgi:trimeric autotransporter adhesin
MATGSLLQVYPFNFKPSAPSVGSFIMYVKTDNNIYLQDSSGNEYPFASTTPITSLTGEATATGPGAAVVTLSNSAVIGKVLTGFSPGPNSAIVATDTILQAFQKLQAQVTATVGSAITALTSDVSATGPGSAAATVNFVGGKSAASVAQSVTDTQAATSANTASTIVKRDASGNFSANVITASLSGNATTATTSTNFTGSLSGDVTGTQSATVVSLVGGASAADVAAATATVDAATSVNTASTLVKRDPSGNFAAGVITANLTGNISGSSSSFTGTLSGDVTGTQSATVVSSVGGSTAANVHSAELAANAATATNTASTIVKRDPSGNFAAGVITANLTGNVSGSAASFTGSLSGDVTGTQSTTSISSPTVTSKILTGYVVGSNTPIAATDSILLAFEKTQGQINATTGAAITALTSDVSATGPGSVAATVNSVGGSSAANIHSAELAANAATSANTASTIVKRDASGNFVASTITANLTGLATNATTAVNFSGSLSGDVTGTQSATAISATTVTGKLITGFVSGAGVVSASDTILTAIDKLDGNINATTGSAITALTGDVVATGPGSVSSTIQTNVVSNSKLAQMPANTLKGNNTGATANALDLTIPQVVTMFGGTPVTQTPDQANAAGTSNTFSRADHIHNIPSGVPVQIGTSNIQGSAPSFSLSDHVHNHGNQTVGTLHAAATTSVNGFMSAADKVKLNTFSSVPGTNTQILISDGTNLNPETVSGDLSNTNTGAFTVNSVGGSSAANIHSAELAANAATSANTVNTIVKRDGSGNFSAGTITASLTGNATNVTGVVAIANGGTNNSSAYTAGSIIYSDGTKLTQDNANFFWNDTNQSIGIGTTPASATFIDGVNTSAATKRVVLTGYGVGSTVGFRNRFARGTSGTPSAVNSGDTLGFISGQGYGTSQFPAASTGAATFVAGETFTNTSNLTYFTVSTTPTASVTAVENFRVASTGLTLGPQSASTSLHQVNGGIQRTTRTITANLTIDTTTTDDIIFCNQSGAITVTLPTPTNGRTLVIKDISGAAATNNITLARHASENIEGLASNRPLATNFGSWTIMADASLNWWIL